MHTNKKKSLITALAMVLLPTIVFAADTKVEDAGSSYNMVLISLVSLMLILLFVIGMLALTIRQLSFVVRDKNRKDRNASIVAKALLILLAIGGSVSAKAADAAAAVAAPVSHSISGIAENDFYAIMTVLALELVVIFSLVINLKLLMRALSTKHEVAESEVAVPQHSWFWDKFNAAASLDKEKDILLDHNYDGIQELDNSLPPWWKYGFYLTIIVGFIYIYRFHISNDGPSQQEEYAAEMQKGEEDKAAYLTLAGNNVDENSVTLLTDAADLAKGKDIFIKTCAACHLNDGGGSVGPNLTDNYWIHGGGIKDIFKTIKYGWQEKGMKSWKDDYSPKEIQQIASFVKSLKGTKPLTPKAEQGELYIEAAAAPAGDSTKNATDTTKATAGK